MKGKEKFKVIIYLFIAFILGGLLMYYISSDEKALSLIPVSSNNKTTTTTQSCRACSETVVVNDGSLSGKKL